MQRCGHSCIPSGVWLGCCSCRPHSTHLCHSVVHLYIYVIKGWHQHIIASHLQSKYGLMGVCPQWGSLEYHKQSLRNLQMATQKTKLMCAVILDTVGRELMIKRDYELDEEVCTRCPPNHRLVPGQTGDNTLKITSLLAVLVCQAHRSKMHVHLGALLHCFYEKDSNIYP